MAEALDIVVTCTDRKSVPAGTATQVRNLQATNDVAGDVLEWRRRLQGSAENRRAARHLYQGETWSACLELERAAQQARGPERVRLWVLSAGYGIVPADQELAPYAATFASPFPDFVGGAATGEEALERVQGWWDALCRIADSTPGSLTEVAKQADGDLLLVLSSSYLRACRADVAQAVAAHSRSIVLAPSAQGSLRFQHAAPPFDARLLTTAADRQNGLPRPITSGTRMSLNVRAATLLVRRLGEGPITRDAACRYLGELTEKQAPLRQFGGDHHDDESVQRFIRSALAEDPTGTKSGLLRRFRDAGNKCEQKRFGRLFDHVAAGMAREGSR